MTIDERAEKIHKAFHPEPHDSEFCLGMITASVREAVEEQHRNDFEKGLFCCMTCFNAGKKESNFQKDQEIVFVKHESAQMGMRLAYEEAAKIAEEHMMRYAKPITLAQQAVDTIARIIATKIRALKETK